MAELSHICDYYFSRAPYTIQAQARRRNRFSPLIFVMKLTIHRRKGLFELLRRSIKGSTSVSPSLGEELEYIMDRIRVDRAPLPARDVPENIVLEIIQYLDSPGILKLCLVVSTA